MNIWERQADEAGVLDTKTSPMTSDAANVPTDQGAREARYAEAMLAGIRTYMGLPDADVVWNFSLVKASGILADSIAPLVDAEVAAAVSEAQAEIERLRRRSKDLYEDGQAQATRAESAEAEVERLREGIRALADEVDGWRPYESRDTGEVYSADPVRDIVTALRALLTGEAVR
jgi:hypothetical protein